MRHKWLSRCSGEVFCHGLQQLSAKLGLSVGRWWSGVVVGWITVMPSMTVMVMGPDHVINHGLDLGQAVVGC